MQDQLSTQKRDEKWRLAMCLNKKQHQQTKHTDIEWNKIDTYTHKTMTLVTHCPCSTQIVYWENSGENGRIHTSEKKEKQQLHHTILFSIQQHGGLSMDITNGPNASANVLLQWRVQLPQASVSVTEMVVWRKLHDAAEKNWVEKRGFHRDLGEVEWRVLKIPALLRGETLLEIWRVHKLVL